MNSEIREFENKIVKEINDSGLPIEVVRLVFCEITTSLKTECDRIIIEEQKAKENQNGK